MKKTILERETATNSPTLNTKYSSTSHVLYFSFAKISPQIFYK